MNEAEIALQEAFVFLFSFHMGVGAERHLKVPVGLWIESGVRSIQDAGRTIRVPLVDDFMSQVRLDEITWTANDLFEEIGTHRVDKMGCKDATGEKIDRIGLPRRPVIGGHDLEKKILPKEGTVDSPVFDLR